MTSFVNFICYRLNITYSELSNFLDGGVRNYTAHTLRNNGKVRTVYKPVKQLKELQKLAVDSVFSKFRTLPCATAYERGCSILKNAFYHRNSNFLAHYDIKDFFGSIKYWHFEMLLEKTYDVHDIRFLWKICSLNDCLPVGAYSSSFISNRIMHAFDVKISTMFKGLQYTRYADDITFSSATPLPDNLEDSVIDTLRTFRFELNEKKSRTFNEKTPKRVTGVTITPDHQLTVGKRYKLAIKKQLYDYITKKKGNRQKILGRLTYIRFIEPNYYKMLAHKYRLNKRLLKDVKFPNGHRRYKQVLIPLKKNRFRLKSKYDNSRSVATDSPDSADVTYTPSNNNSNKCQPKSNRANSQKTSSKKGTKIALPLIAIAVVLLIFSAIAVFLIYGLSQNNPPQKKTIGSDNTVLSLTEENYKDYLYIQQNYELYSDRTVFTVSYAKRASYSVNHLSYEIDYLRIAFIVAYNGATIYEDTPIQKSPTNRYGTFLSVKLLHPLRISIDLDGNYAVTNPQKS